MTPKAISEALELELLILDAAIESSGLFEAIAGDLDQKRSIWGDAAELNDDPEYELDEEHEQEIRDLAKRIAAVERTLAHKTSRRADWETVKERYLEALDLDTEYLLGIRKATIAVHEQAAHVRQVLDALRRKWGPQAFDDEGVEDFIWERVTEDTPAELRKARELEDKKWELALVVKGAMNDAAEAAGPLWEDRDLASRFNELVVGEE